jgi:hypothetical protein
MKGFFTMKKKEIREANIQAILENVDDPGRFGRAKELLRARPNSKKTEVAKQGETDNHVAIRYGEKIRYVKAESKTNGGRVDKILDGTQTEEYVIYSLHFIQKYRPTKTAPAREEIRDIPDIIIPMELFRSLLLELGCYKDIAHDGIKDGIGIQPSSKKLFLRLQAYIDNYGESVLFNNTKVFDSWELEGLEI